MWHKTITRVKGNPIAFRLNRVPHSGHGMNIDTKWIRPKKTVTLRVRCSEALRTDLARIAAFKESEVSAVVREACKIHVMNYQRQVS